MEFENIKAFLLQPVEVLDFEGRGRSVRIHNCLRNDNIIFVAEIYAHQRGEFLRMPNMGYKCVDSLMDALKNKGLPHDRLIFKDRNSVLKASTLEKLEQLLTSDFIKVDLQGFKKPERNSASENIARDIVQTLFPQVYQKKLINSFSESVKSAVASDPQMLGEILAIKDAIKVILSDNILEWMDDNASEPLSEKAVTEVSVSKEAAIVESFLPKDFLKGLSSEFKKVVIKKLSDDEVVSPALTKLSRNIEAGIKGQLLKGLDHA